MIKTYYPHREKTDNIIKNGSMCAIPWIHFVTYPSGSAQICTHQSDSSVTLGNIFENSFEEIMNHENLRKLRLDMISGKKNSLCSNCHIFEKASDGYSTRTYLLEDYSHLIPESISNTNEEGFFDLKYFKFAFWQFKLSGVCNFKCRTCHPTFSTSIYHEQKSNNWLDESQIMDFRKIKENIPGVIENIFKYIDSVELVHFVGGEPILMNEHWEILEGLIKHNRLDVNLRYHTNLSRLTYKNKHVFDYWRKFTGSLWISPSVDAFDKRNAYIREGANWNNFNNNFDELVKLKDEIPNFSIYPTITISVFNVLYIDELVDYLMTKNINYLNFNIVRYPDFYHLSLIPEELKISALNKLDNCADRNGLEREIFNIIKIELYNEQIMSQRKELHRLFKEETLKLDAVRKQKFSELFPELAALLN